MSVNHGKSRSEGPNAAVSDSAGEQCGRLRLDRPVTEQI